MKWLDVTYDAVYQLGGVAQLKEIYSFIEKSYGELIPTWKASVRRSIEYHSSDSKAYQGKKDLFQSVKGIGKGVWAIREMNMPYNPKSDQIINIPRTVGTKISRIIRDTKIIKELKTLYMNKCQVCNTSISIGEYEYSEGHHIKPLGKPHLGPDIESNIIILCPNHHVLFDYGMMAIDPDDFALLPRDSNIRNTETRFKHQIDRKFLEYHLVNIYQA